MNLTDEDDRASYGAKCNIGERIRVRQREEMVWPPLPW